MKIPELLAPAGNASCALAAFDAGADAVYAGLKRFNARERTGNFTEDELARVIAYAHRLGRKVYVTMNTLIKESELEDMAQCLSDLEKMGPDALIVQDLGVASMIHDYFPSLVLHGSTQMGIHNSAGIRAAQEMGVKRVILERQTSLKEIELISKKCPGMELEVFIHGALCCCVSGSCLLSSWLGGWSGNRGKCKQPCRRRYHSGKGNGFFLSVQDLCSMDILPRLISAGVASLKIEGRLRRPDYVSGAVSAYRMLLDNADPGKYDSLLPAARERMAHTYGRKWSQGFFTGASCASLVKEDALGASGQLCGSVVSVSSNSVTVEVTRRIHIGDAVRLQPRSGDEGPAFSLTRMTVNGESVFKALKGDLCTVFTDKTAPVGSILYKTGESCTDYTKRIAALPLPLPKLPLKLRLSQNQFSAVLPSGETFIRPLELREASAHPVQPDTLLTEFANHTSAGCEYTAVEAQIAGSLFLPASVLKSIRKDFSAWLPDHFDAASLDAGRNARTAALLAELKSRKHTPAPFPDTVILPRGKRPPDTAMSIARRMEDDPSPHEELVLPFYIPESDLSSVRAGIARFVQKGGKTVRVTAMHQFTLLKEFPQLTLRTSFPLPVCNSSAALLLKRFGADSVQAWIELEKPELDAFARKSPLPVEQFIYGRPVLLTTRAGISVSGDISDARGNIFRVHHANGLTQITAGKVMDLPRLRSFDSAFTDLTFAVPGEKDGALFNFDYELK